MVINLPMSPSTMTTFNPDVVVSSQSGNLFLVDGHDLVNLMGGHRHNKFRYAYMQELNTAGSCIVAMVDCA